LVKKTGKINSISLRIAIPKYEYSQYVNIITCGNIYQIRKVFLSPATQLPAIESKTESTL